MVVVLVMVVVPFVFRFLVRVVVESDGPRRAKAGCTHVCVTPGGKPVAGGGLDRRGWSAPAAGDAALDQPPRAEGTRPRKGNPTTAGSKPASREGGKDPESRSRRLSPSTVRDATLGQ